MTLLNGNLYNIVVARKLGPFLINNEQLSSKFIKILRESKFTEKRNPYKKYNKAKWNWAEIFEEINLLKNETPKILKEMSKKYGINYKILKNKYSCCKNNKEFNFDEENRGGSNKTFNENEERNIFLFIKENFIDKNKVLCNDIIKIYANNKFKELYSNGKFNASDGWCNMFKKR